MISIAGLDLSSRPDPAKLWSDFKEDFLTNAFPIIRRDVRRYHAADNEILGIIQERHRHQREKHLERMNQSKNAKALKRMRVNQRVVSVCILIIFHIAI
jgi:DNA-binding MltR family transcriptional regulator